MCPYQRCIFFRVRLTKSKRSPKTTLQWAIFGPNESLCCCCGPTYDRAKLSSDSRPDNAVSRRHKTHLRSTRLFKRIHQILFSVSMVNFMTKFRDKRDKKICYNFSPFGVQNVYFKIAILHLANESNIVIVFEIWNT